MKIPLSQMETEYVQSCFKQSESLMYTALLGWNTPESKAAYKAVQHAYSQFIVTQHALGNQHLTNN